MLLSTKSKTDPNKGFILPLRSRAGFMFLEVMLSVFVIGVGIIFVASSFITSVKASKVSKSYLDMLHLLEEKMWGYEEPGKIEEGSDSGEFDDHGSAAWTAEARKIEDSPLNEATVEVLLEEGGKKRRLKVATYFFDEE